MARTVPVGDRYGSRIGLVGYLNIRMKVSSLSLLRSSCAPPQCQSSEWSEWWSWSLSRRRRADHRLLRLSSLYTLSLRSNEQIGSWHLHTDLSRKTVAYLRSSRPQTNPGFCQTPCHQISARSQILLLHLKDCWMHHFQTTVQHYQQSSWQVKSHPHPNGFFFSGWTSWKVFRLLQWKNLYYSWQARLRPNHLRQLLNSISMDSHFFPARIRTNYQKCNYEISMQNLWAWPCASLPSVWLSWCSSSLHHACHKHISCFWPRSGELRTQKLKSHLVRTQSLNVLPLKPGVGQ